MLDYSGTFAQPADSLEPNNMPSFAGVPIPGHLAAQGEEIEAAIQQSLKECGDQSLTGAETTPFLLKRIQELTHGKSLAANIALIKHNAAVGALIASELSHLDKG